MLLPTLARWRAFQAPASTRSSQAGFPKSRRRPDVEMIEADNLLSHSSSSKLASNQAIGFDAKLADWISEVKAMRDELGNADARPQPRHVTTAAACPRRAGPRQRRGSGGQLSTGCGLFVYSTARANHIGKFRPPHVTSPPPAPGRHSGCGHARIHLAGGTGLLLAGAGEVSTGAGAGRTCCEPLS